MIGPRTVHELADVVNRMRPGQCLDLDPRQLAQITWNDLHYGQGRDGFERALRGNVIGSGFGTMKIRDREMGGIRIEKHPEGERTHDRDGYPVGRGQ